MWFNSIRSHSLSVEPCSIDPDCFRWVVRSPDGTRTARSRYAFATRVGAQISGEFWRRAYEAGQPMR